MSVTMTAPQIGTTAHIAIADIVVDPNIRKNVTVPKTFAASVKQHGVLQPVDAYFDTATGKWHLQDGQLRYLASLDAGHDTLFVLVGDPALAEVRRIEKQLILNEQRNELTPADLAGAHQTLFDLGVGAEQISRRTNTPKKRVEQLLAIAKSPVLEYVVHHARAGRRDRRVRRRA
jgi:ParB family chromosome partitioning protein